MIFRVLNLFRSLILPKIGILTEGTVLSSKRIGLDYEELEYKTKVIFKTKSGLSFYSTGYPTTDYPHPCSPTDYSKIGEKVPVYYLKYFPFFNYTVHD